MNKRFLLIATALTTLTANAIAQNTDKDTGVTIQILPDGVTASVGIEPKFFKQKNIVVAGAPGKGYKAFFAASDAQHGEELWVTDGTKEGTHLVKDICEGTSSSTPSYLARFNDKVLFAADAGDGFGSCVWISDGTEEGTKMIAITNEIGNSDPIAFCQIDETHAVFAAVSTESYDANPDKPTHGVFITDGTKEGTHLVSDNVDWRIPGMKSSTVHRPFVRVGRKVFFKGIDIDNKYGEELWVTDGTEEGTYMVKDIGNKKAGEGTTNTVGGEVKELENYKNKYCFFSAKNFENGYEYYMSDGTEEGTRIVKEFCTDVNQTTGEGQGSQPYGPSWQVFNDCIFARARNAVNGGSGSELAAFNLDSPDKSQIFDLWPGTHTDSKGKQVANSTTPDPGVVFDGCYMFWCNDGTDPKGDKNFNHGGELWYYDGKNAPRLHYDFAPGVLSDFGKEAVVANGSMYWTQGKKDEELAAGFGSGLYRLDSKDEQPVVCKPLSATGDEITTLRNLDGKIIYSSNSSDENVKRGIYVYSYTKAGWDGKTDKGELEETFDPDGTINGISDATINNAKNTRIDVYTIGGIRVRTNVNAANATSGLAKGIYIVGNKKVVVE